MATTTMSHVTYTECYSSTRLEWSLKFPFYFLRIWNFRRQHTIQIATMAFSYRHWTSYTACIPCAIPTCTRRLVGHQLDIAHIVHTRFSLKYVVSVEGINVPFRIINWQIENRRVRYWSSERGQRNGDQKNIGEAFMATANRGAAVFSGPKIVYAAHCPIMSSG